MTKITNPNLLLIQYPSGGYGYYLARLINSFVTNVVITPDLFDFDELGTSHSLPLVIGDIHHEQKRTTLNNIDAQYCTEDNQHKYIVIPYCPGIQNDTTDNIKTNYPTAKIIRLCYFDNTWPLIFQNCIVKALKGTTENNIEFDSSKFGSSDSWARRENFSLLFEHHHYRNMWKPHVDDQFLNVDIYTLLSDPQQCLHQVANLIGGSTAQLDQLPTKHQIFFDANPNTVKHFDILRTVQMLPEQKSLRHIDTLYHQAVLNFYIQTKFDFTIPSNDYANWFTNTQEIVTMLKDHGVNIDTN